MMTTCNMYGCFWNFPFQRVFKHQGETAMFLKCIYLWFHGNPCWPLNLLYILHTDIRMLMLIMLCLNEQGSTPTQICKSSDINIENQRLMIYKLVCIRICKTVAKHASLGSTLILYEGSYMPGCPHLYSMSIQSCWRVDCSKTCCEPRPTQHKPSPVTTAQVHQTFDTTQLRYEFSVKSYLVSYGCSGRCWWTQRRFCGWNCVGWMVQLCWKDKQLTSKAGCLLDLFHRTQMIRDEMVMPLRSDVGCMKSEKSSARQNRCDCSTTCNKMSYDELTWQTQNA